MADKKGCVRKRGRTASLALGLPVLENGFKKLENDDMLVVSLGERVLTWVTF